jgi:hypothetical protein
MSRPGGPVECSPGREAGVIKAQVVQPRRGVRVGLLESYAPPGLYIFAYGHPPALWPGLHSIGPTGPSRADYLDRLLKGGAEASTLS